MVVIDAHYVMVVVMQVVNKRVNVSKGRQGEKAPIVVVVRVLAVLAVVVVVVVAPIVVVALT